MFVISSYTYLYTSFFITFTPYIYFYLVQFVCTVQVYMSQGNVAFIYTPLFMR